MGERLANPPLLEAVCELRFAQPVASLPWVANEVHKRLEREFPQRTTDEQERIAVHVEGGSAPRAEIQKVGREQFRTLDGSAMVQVGDDFLAVNHLRPYTRWEDFQQMIVRAAQAWRESVGASVITRVGLRYINHLALEPRQQPPDVCAVWPGLRKSLDLPLRTFLQRYELTVEDPPGTLIHQTGLLPTPTGNVVVLDIDLGMAAPTWDSSPFATLLDRGHDLIHRAFVDSLAPAYYERLRSRLPGGTG